MEFSECVTNENGTRCAELEFKYFTEVLGKQWEDMGEGWFLLLEARGNRLESAAVASDFLFPHITHLCERNQREDLLGDEDEEDVTAEEVDVGEDAGEDVYVAVDVGVDVVTDADVGEPSFASDSTDVGGRSSDGAVDIECVTKNDG